MIKDDASTPEEMAEAAINAALLQQALFQHAAGLARDGLKKFIDGDDEALSADAGRLRALDDMSRMLKRIWTRSMVQATDCRRIIEWARRQEASAGITPTPDSPDLPVEGEGQCAPAPTGGWGGKA